MRRRPCKRCRKPLSLDAAPNTQYHEKCFAQSRREYLRRYVKEHASELKKSRRMTVDRHAATDKGRKTHGQAARAYQKKHKRLGLCSRCSREVYRGGLCELHWNKWKEWYEKRKRSGKDGKE